MTQSVAGRLSGKVAIVTGAGSQGEGVGTGKAIAILFARAGAIVSLVDVAPERAEETAATISEQGGTALVFGGDVTSASACERIVADTRGRFGRVDVLVNNVGIVPKPARVGDVDEEEWDRILGVNLKGTMLMTKFALPAMIEAGGGAIVNVSSIGSMVSTGLIPAYGASKAALNRLTVDTAVGYGRDGIRANAVAPGFVETPLVSRHSEERLRERREIAPLGTRGTAWDVAFAALFLASDESRWITGVCLPVDAGLTQISPLQAHALLTEPERP
jgi:NAD(P)-dependent dehydrogenase (short-subunit alcohol dehydrogenase family)